MSDCDRFLEALASDRLESDHRTHAQGCATCRLLLPLDGGEAPATGPALEAVHRRALEAARATPVRPWSRDAARFAFFQGAVALAVAATLGASNWTWPGAHRVALAMAAAFLLALVTVGSVGALAPGRRRSRLLLLLAPLVPVLLLDSGNGVHTATTFRSEMGCLVTVLLTAVVPLAVGLALLRGVALDAPRTAALGLSAASTGLFALDWHCTDGSGPHLLCFHVLPWLAVGLLAIPIRRAMPTTSHVP